MARRFLLMPILAGALLASCQACPPEAYALIRCADYSTPESAGRSFLAALGCDDAEAEYRCFGEGFKAQHGATLDGYILFRAELRQEAGNLFDYAFQLQHVASEAREDGVMVWWGRGGDRLVGLRMTPQHFFDVYVGDGRKVGGFLPGTPAGFIELSGDELRLEIREDSLRGLSRPSEVERVVLGSEWKIDDVVVPQEG